MLKPNSRYEVEGRQENNYVATTIIQLKTMVFNWVVEITMTPCGQIVIFMLEIPSFAD